MRGNDRLGVIHLLQSTQPPVLDREKVGMLIRILLHVDTLTNQGKTVGIQIERYIMKDEHGILSQARDRLPKMQPRGKFDTVLVAGGGVLPDKP